MTTPITTIPTPLRLYLLSPVDRSPLEQFDTTSLVSQLGSAPLGLDLAPLLSETMDYETLITHLTIWRDHAQALIPAPHKVATLTKRDEEMTAEDRQGWISATHATDGEGHRITTYQKLEPQEDHVYGPLVAELERFIVFLSHGAEQGALLSRGEAQEEPTSSPPPAPVHSLEEETPAAVSSTDEVAQ